MSDRRALSIRVPSNLYCEIAALAQEEGVDLNTKINELIRMGLGEDKSLTKALRSMVKRHLISEGEEI